MIQDYVGPDGEQVTAACLEPDTFSVIAKWCFGAVVEEIHPETGERFGALNVQCKDEVKRASLNDYIVRGKNGFDVMKPNEFGTQHELLL